MAYKYNSNEAEKFKNEMEQKVLDISKNFSQNPDELLEYLKFSQKFYEYSSRNKKLIYSQNRGAELCGSYQSFQEMGYQVQKGEKGMKILVPVTKKFLIIDDKMIPLNRATVQQKEMYNNGTIKCEKKLVFKYGNVFDIAQTDCPKEDYPKILDLGYSSEQHSQLCNVLKEYSNEVLNCIINEDDFSSVNHRGYYSPALNSISISRNFDDTSKLSILSHELGHAILHNNKALENDNRPNCQIEFEADAFSIMIQEYMGVDITKSRKNHISNQHSLINEKFSEKAEVMINSSLDRVTTAFKELVDFIKPHMAELTQNQSIQQETMQNNALDATPIYPNMLPDTGINSMNLSM